ncbi:hypothetical protein BaRGS_00034782 [Batillaria attramentaria]|uniref:Uncharacterized protein n=1 Tax=Batillaria attramentaria TaxID=370345 RepID=A0ABD0JGI9_9CAEN
MRRRVVIGEDRHVVHLRPAIQHTCVRRSKKIQNTKACLLSSGQGQFLKSGQAAKSSSLFRSKAFEFSRVSELAESVTSVFVLQNQSGDTRDRWPAMFRSAY